MHCLIYMKRGGKMEQETEKKSNRKIHIIFAIFTLILSFGISFIDVSAAYYVPNDLENDNKCRSYIDSSSYVITLKLPHGNTGKYQYIYYIFDETIKVDDDYYFYNSVGEKKSVKKILVFFEYNANFSYIGGGQEPNHFDSFEHEIPYDKNKLPLGDYGWRHTQLEDTLITFSSSKFDVYNLNGNIVFRKPPAPVGKVAEVLPEVVTVNSQVIIGGTICFLALMIFLVILVRHLRTVSQGY